ncbi:MAG: hypothetical protein A4S14_06110 [Proteobacteria bacterium SG_bin9]|nr:MAG: hypothetical protein A4S14_06110 [Proteobacteria bacterium SG_bin9]
MPFHPDYRSFPIGDIGNVESNEVVVGWRSPGIMSVCTGEFKVIRLARKTKHDAIKPIMALEAIELL